MEPIEPCAILRKIDLFQSMTDEELDRLTQVISQVEIEGETELFHEGDVGRDMYILVEGSLQIYKKNRRLTAIFPPDYVGEMSIFDDKPRSATVIATAGSKLFVITTKQFDRYFVDRPQALVAMIKTMSRRIRQDNELVSAEFTKANILIHDMRNTISAFLLLDLLQKTCQSPRDLEYLNLMQRSRRDLAEMMNEALANAKRLNYQKESRDSSLVDLIEELIESDFTVHPDLTDKRITFNFTDNIPKFTFQRTDIRRVITNLAINAAQASESNASILISLSQNDGQAIISFVDEGCGILAEIQNKIFLPHFSSKEGGSGFGLASCKQIIEEQHGGLLSFTSQVGKGSTFVFTLPMNQ